MDRGVHVATGGAGQTQQERLQSHGPLQCSGALRRFTLSILCEYTFLTGSEMVGMHW